MFSESYAAKSFELNCLLSILDIIGVKLSDSFDFTDGSVVPSASVLPPALVLTEDKDDDDCDGSGVPPLTSSINAVALLEMESSRVAADDASELYKQERSDDDFFLDFVDCEILEPKSELTGKSYSSKFILLL